MNVYLLIALTKSVYWDMVQKLHISVCTPCCKRQGPQMKSLLVNVKNRSGLSKNMT